MNKLTPKRLQFQHQQHGLVGSPQSQGDYDFGKSQDSHITGGRHFSESDSNSQPNAPDKVRAHSHRMETKVNFFSVTFVFFFDLLCFCSFIIFA